MAGIVHEFVNGPVPKMPHRLPTSTTEPEPFEAKLAVIVDAPTFTKLPDPEVSYHYPDNVAA